jgi:hypothetical protein
MYYPLFEEPNREGCLGGSKHLVSTHQLITKSYVAELE